ncbi:toxin-antitoxin system YwqK family antitoxin [Flavobacteriaceae bacterium M23B6Z8]
MFTKKSCSFIIAFFVLVSIIAQKQQDTLWFNSQWKKTDKEDAAFFRPPVVKEGDVYKIRDFYSSGELQMEGYSQKKEKDFFQGEVVWYTKDGAVYQKAFYKDNKLDGYFITYHQGKEFKALYKNGRFVSGEQNTVYSKGTNRLIEIRDSLYREVYYADDLEGIRYENIFISDVKKTSKYFNEKGELIGELLYTNEGVPEMGEEVFYYFNPMAVQVINHYKNKKVIGNTIYRKDGSLIEKFVQTPGYKSFYYDASGKIIGELAYRLDREWLKPFEGVRFYYSTYSGETVLRSKEIYKIGLLEYKELYENGVVVEKTTYDKNLPLKSVFYNADGSEEGTLIYDNGYPKEGMKVNGGRVFFYEDSKKVGEEHYYKTGELFMNKKDSLAVYYDKTGGVLGKLSLSGDYADPLNGTEYSLNYKDEISDFREYVNGKITKETLLTDGRWETDKKFKKVIFYSKNGYDKTKEISFYSNGTKQSDIDYKNYKEVKGIFYDMNETVIGEYDYKAKEGKRYLFFPYSDIIKEVEEIRNNIPIRYKRYEYNYIGLSNERSRVLLEDIDTAKKGRFYSKDGILLAEVNFKDRKAWEGTVYDHSSREKYTIREGQRNGAYYKYDYNGSVIEQGNYLNDLKEGVFITFDRSGNKRSEVIYVQDRREGLAVYFDNDGKTESKLVYKNDLPYEGTLTKKGYRNTGETKEIYKEGILKKRTESLIDEVRVSTFGDNEIVFVKTYDRQGDHLKYQYNLKSGQLDGEVIRYRKNGSPEYHATMKNGNLIAGTLLVTPSYSRGEKYLMLTKENSTYSLKSFNEKGETMLEITEKLPEDGYSNYINKLGFNLDYIDYRYLY